jgi:SAM-dependent methyltransferase
MPATYYPDVFNVNDIPSAMRIILTPEGTTTEERWRIETPYLADLIASKIEITPDTILIDYGCGIGRMAKELIARHGCRVIGVDISPSMRALAVIYVASDRFFSCAPTMLDAIVERGFSCDAAISIWVLQHCAKPADDIARLRRAVKPAGHMFVVNNDTRAVPIAEQGWTDDGIDIKAMLRGDFVPQEEGRPAREMTTESIARHTFWASFRQRG